MAASGKRGDDAASLLRTLERDAISPVYLIYGEEDYLVDRGLRTVLARVAGGAAPERFRGNEPDLGSRVAEALSTAPLFGGVPTVVVGDVDSLREAAQEALLPALDSRGPGHLLLVGRSPDLRRRLFARCVREGWAFGFRRVPIARVPSFLREEAKSRGHALSPQGAELLAELVGPHLRTGANEIEKLSLYVGPKSPIDVDAISKVVGGVRARSVLELGWMIERRDAAGALRLGRRLLRQGESPIGLTAFLANQVRRMLAAKSLGTERSHEVAGSLGVSPWVAERILAGARRYDRRGLESALGQLAKLDMALKSSRTPPLILLEDCLRKVTGRDRGVTRPASRPAG